MQNAKSYYLLYHQYIIRIFLNHLHIASVIIIKISWPYSKDDIQFPKGEL